jgi:hypothetical protein
MRPTSSGPGRAARVGIGLVLAALGWAAPGVAAAGSGLSLPPSVQAGEAVEASFRYSAQGLVFASCPYSVDFTWDGVPWVTGVSAQLRNRSCEATISAPPPAAAAGDHQVCAAGGHYHDCGSLVLVAPVDSQPRPAPSPPTASPPPPTPTPTPTPSSSPSPSPTTSPPPLASPSPPAASPPAGSTRTAGDRQPGASAGLPGLLVLATGTLLLEAAVVLLVRRFW